jgi:uncharacterized alkaline shock family protein YloU
MTDDLVIDGDAGTITIAAAVVGGLVQAAAEGVAGTRVRRRRRGVDVTFDDGRAHVQLELAARYGAVLPELARTVQEDVSAALAEACDVDVAAVDVAIEELDD